MEEQKKNDLKKVFLGQESIEKIEKWFNFYKKLPTIWFIVIISFFFIWGIVDPCVFGIYGYGIMELPSGFLCWFIWQIISIIFASLTFISTKISFSYKILHIEYLKKITDKEKDN